MFPYIDERYVVFKDDQEAVFSLADFLEKSERIVLEDYGTEAPYLTARIPEMPWTHLHVFSWDADASEHAPSAIREG